MKRHSLAHVRYWVFDLDNTLYPAHIRLFDQIEQKMRLYMADYLNITPQKADELRQIYWRDYGTTLAGMMKNHAMPPDNFLEFVHNIDFKVLSKAPHLQNLISALPGKKFVFTNGTAHTSKTVRANGTKLMHESVTTQNCPIIDMYMSGKRCIIDKNNVITNNTVMPYMNVSHQ